MNEQLLGNATWTDMATTATTAATASVRPILAVPIGSCEQHGPHLPLDTDTRIACAVATGLAATVPKVVVTPPIGISASGEHAGFAGTLSIGTTALEMVLVELARSADWSAGVVFVNGHGGNHTSVLAATAILVAEGRNVLAWSPSTAGGDAHAGRTETSLMLSIAADTVRVGAAQPGRTEPLGELLPLLRRSGVAHVSPNGVLGDPTGATAQEGAALLAALVDDLVARVTAWLQRVP